MATRGLSTAAAKAAEYVKHHPNITGPKLAQKFGLNVTTVYRAAWWKQRHNLHAIATRVANIAK